MTRAVFISDIHLKIDNGHQRRLFTSFLDSVVSAGDRLYILGDLFDYWANNGPVRRSFAWVFQRLEDLAASGCSVGMLVGNRDFLLRRAVVERRGIAYLGEEAAAALGGKQFFLAHGHTLCLEDTQFLGYRARMWPVFKALDLVLPGCIENRLALLFQQRSKQVIQAQDQSRFRFTRAAIEEKFSSGFDYVICGHTHQQETFAAGGHVFYALPAWEERTGSFLEYHGGRLQLHTIGI